MANHGVVTFGSSLENAYMKMETVEHFAKIALVTHLLGHEQPLGEKEVEKLAAVRDRYNGDRRHHPVAPSRPDYFPEFAATGAKLYLFLAILSCYATEAIHRLHSPQNAVTTTPLLSYSGVPR